MEPQGYQSQEYGNQGYQRRKPQRLFANLLTLLWFMLRMSVAGKPFKLTQDTLLYFGCVVANLH